MFLMGIRPKHVLSQGGGRSNRGNHSRGRGRGHNRRPPHCQLCLTNGHYATTCPSLYTYATQASPSSDESLAKAFHAQCHVNTNTPNWHVDSGATDHMTPACDSLHHSSPYPGNGNGHVLEKPTTGSSTSSHPMTTRSKAGIFKHKHHADLASLTTHPLHVALLSTTEPRGFKTAVKWILNGWEALNESFQTLKQIKHGS
ncbi:zinc finger, CCHC-type containing LTR copia-type gag-polypeptide [Tanacetum coccineum]